MNRSPTATRVEGDAFLLQHALEAEVRHESSNHDRGIQLAASFSRRAIISKNRIAINQSAAARHEQRTIAISIKGNSEICAAGSSSDAISESRCTAPQPALMFVPFGDAWITTTSAPSRAAFRSNLAHRAVRAVHDNAQTASQSPLGKCESRNLLISFEPACDVRGQQYLASGNLHRSDLRCETRAVRKRVFRSQLSSASFSFVPSDANTLMPLSSYGLCEAEIMTPPA